MTWILALLLIVSTSRAVDVGEAEHIRLSEDIEQLANRQLWPGAEKKFAELERLGVEMTYADLWNGALAARSLGNAEAAYNRLKVAAKVKGTKEVINWLVTIDANYGLVELIATPPRGIVLDLAEMPFDPDQRIAVDAAKEHVRKEGGFKGLLPRGNYVFAGQPFKVEPGLSLRIEVSPRMKKTQGEIVNVTTTPAELVGTDGQGVPAPH